MIKTSSTTLLEKWEFWWIKIENLEDPLENKTSEKSNGPTEKSDEKFSEKKRINRTTFSLLLNTLWDGLLLTPTNFVPEPISPDRQLTVSLYRLAHVVTYTFLEDIFGLLKESGCVFFNKVIRLNVAYFNDEYVKLPETDKQREVEVRGFIEN